MELVKIFIIKLRSLLLCKYLYYGLLLITILYLLIYTYFYTAKYKYNINENNFTFEIINYYIDSDKLSIELYGKENVVGTYYFENENESIEFKDKYLIGDIIEVNGVLSIPNNNTIPNTFNYKKYLLYKKVNYMLKINTIKKINSSSNPLIKLKNYLYKRINNINNNEYLYAFILGNSKYLDKEITDNYKINTITHLFALSGLHVSILANVIDKLLNKINKKIKLIIVSLFLILLCYAASFSPSILRATIFYILLSLNKIYDTFIKSKYLLYITFCIMIFINPFYIYNLGFILSFTITYFLLLSNENIKIKNKIISLFIMSLIAMIGSLPIIINNFYKINIIGFINNLFFVPYVSYIIYPLSLLSFLMPFLMPLLNLLTSLMEIVSSISIKVLNVSIAFPKVSTLIIILYYLVFILVVKYKKKIFFIFLLFIIVLSYYKESFNKDTCIYFIDVAQGDSALIKTKNNKYILVDTGGKEEYYNNDRNHDYNLMTDSMIPFFNSIGIRKIDYLFLTHGDADHSGNAKYLINNMKVDKIYINNGNINYLESNIRHSILLDSYIKIDNINIYSLNNVIYDNENDNSIILLIKIYNYQILLMADASIKVEKELLKKYYLNDITILKLGHHGSNTSTSDELLEITNPKYSIISVSKNNKYKHPSQETIDKLNKYNLTYYETSKYGTIQFCFSANKVKQKTYIP